MLARIRNRRRRIYMGTTSLVFLILLLAIGRDFLVKGYDETSGLGRSCSPSEGICKDECTNLNNDRDHCGSCDNKCALGAPVCCDGSCVNTFSSSKHCGKCNVGCADNHACCRGHCLNILEDSNNCGACFQKCEEDQICLEGSCESLDSQLGAVESTTEASDQASSSSSSSSSATERDEEATSISGDNKISVVLLDEEESSEDDQQIHESQSQENYLAEETIEKIEEGEEEEEEGVEAQVSSSSSFDSSPDSTSPLEPESEKKEGEGEGEGEGGEAERQTAGVNRRPFSKDCDCSQQIPKANTKWACCEGTCKDVYNDDDNCGGCNVQCSMDQGCKSSDCVAK